MSLRINSSFIIGNILDYFPLINKLKIVKYSKKYQMIMNLSILNYQIYFLQFLLIKQKNFDLIGEIGEIINDKQVEENFKKEKLIYNSIEKQLNEENIYLDDNFKEKYKCLKTGDSVIIIIDYCSDLNIIEERMKLLHQKNINIKKIEYYHNYEQQDKNENKNNDEQQDENKSMQSEEQDKDKFEQNNILDKDYFDKLIMYNIRDSNFYITGELYETFTFCNNNKINPFIRYNQINIFTPNNIENYSKFLPLEYIKKNTIYSDLEYINNNIICFDYSLDFNANVSIDISYKYINIMCLENLIELNIELNIGQYLLFHELKSKEENFISTSPYKLPNLKKLKCVNFFPNFYDLKNIIKIVYIVEKKYCDKIKCAYFEKEFPFIIAFFRKESESEREYSSDFLNFLLSDFDKNNIHNSLKYVHLSYDSYSSNRIYKRNFEKNKLKINEDNLSNLYNGKSLIPHYISDNFSSIRIANFNEKYHEEIYNEELGYNQEKVNLERIYCDFYSCCSSIETPVPFIKQKFFKLYIEEDPIQCKIKEIYFPFLLYNNVIQNSTIRIHSYKTLEKIYLYVYNFNFVYSKLFDVNNIKLINLRKVYLCFGKININIFKTKIKNFLEKITNNISSIIISIINPDKYIKNKEYFNLIKEYIFSLPFIIKNDKIKNKIIIVKFDPKSYEEGKYEFEENEEDDEEFEDYNEDNEEFEDYNEDDEEFEEYDDDDEMFKDYKIIERTRMKKNKKKVIRHHPIKELFKNG